MGVNAVMMRHVVKAHQELNSRSGMTNEYRSAKANNSGLAIFMRKHSSVQAPTDPKAIWAYESKRKTTKLSFLMLIYLYTQDDDIVSKKEKRSVNKILKRNSNYLNSDDYDDILKFIDELPTIQYVMKYIEQNNVKEKIFSTSVSTVKKYISKNDTYKNILNDLINQYKTI